MLKNRKIALFLVLFFMVLGFTKVYADGIIIPRPIPEIPRPTYLNIKYHRVTVDIDNQIATTQVDQVFINPYNRNLEGEYIFPLPENAAISSFQMEVDGQMVEGKLLDKDEARQIYENIVRQQKDPALLEYVGRNMFRARVYPIPAKGEKRIKLKYTQTLNANNGVVEYMYPLDTEKFSPKPLNEVTVAIDVQSKVPIKAFYSPSHDMSITRKGDGRIKASFEKANYKPDKNVVIYYTLSDKEFGVNLLTHKENGKEGYFLMFVAPRDETSRDDVIPKDVVFVLDKSGSMNDKGKMDNAKKALTFCLSNMNSVDRFNIVAFSDEILKYSGELVPASDNHINKAKKFTEGLKPIGGTNIRDAMVKALEGIKNSGRAKYIIFLTDGLPTVGITDAVSIENDVKKANKNTRIFTFGVGYDVNTILLDNLAKKNKGVSEYIKPDENMEIKISNFYKKISNPLLSDVVLS
ncbi:MAG: VIT and vWA domain-containing protein, partial [Vulcanimicrobiota bacterium]